MHHAYSAAQSQKALAAYFSNRQLLHFGFAEQQSQLTQNIYITFVQCWTNVEDVGPMLYKCYINVLRLPGFNAGSLRGLDTYLTDIQPMPAQC